MPSTNLQKKSVRREVPDCGTNPSARGAAQLKASRMPIFEDRSQRVRLGDKKKKRRLPSEEKLRHQTLSRASYGTGSYHTRCTALRHTPYRNPAHAPVVLLAYPNGQRSNSNLHGQTSLVKQRPSLLLLPSPSSPSSPSSSPSSSSPSSPTVRGHVPRMLLGHIPYASRRYAPRSRPIGGGHSRTTEQ
eukprot:587501-Rhodomonas_salina.1